MLMLITRMVNKGGARLARLVAGAPAYDYTFTYTYAYTYTLIHTYVYVYVYTGGARVARAGAQLRAAPQGVRQVRAAVRLRLGASLPLRGDAAVHGAGQV